MRPTIPIAEWKIAVDLTATRGVQNQPGTPAYGCSCRWCTCWSRIWGTALPVDLQRQLQRLNIDVPHPSDLYATEERPDGAHCRVVYHVAGRLLSGPAAWREDSALGKVLVYQTQRESPKFVGLVVVPSRQTFDPAPTSREVDRDQLLQVDLRLWVPLLGAPSPGSCESIIGEV